MICLGYLTQYADTIFYPGHYTCSFWFLHTSRICVFFLFPTALMHVLFCSFIYIFSFIHKYVISACMSVALSNIHVSVNPSVGSSVDSFLRLFVRSSPNQTDQTHTHRFTHTFFHFISNKKNSPASPSN